MIYKSILISEILLCTVGTFINGVTFPRLCMLVLFISELMQLKHFSHGDFTTIVDLPEGEHQYKFLVDGQWVHKAEEVRHHSKWCSSSVVGNSGG